MACMTSPHPHFQADFVRSDPVTAGYILVLIGLPLSSILVPILLLILFFSTPSLRRTFLFAVNVLIVLLGIAEGILNTILQSLLVLDPNRPVSTGLFMAYLGLTFCTPIVVDSVLILRLNSVYPATLTSRAARLAILAVPLFCSAARFACVSVFIRQWILAIGRAHTLPSHAVWPQNRMIIADWSIQLFENFYCSALFLFRLRGHRAFASRMYRNQTIATRLRAIFYIAVSNFVFPTIFSIVQLIYIIHDTSSMVDGAILLTINNYVSIIGVLFSTLWCFSPTWKGKQNNTLCFQSDANLALPQSMITLSGIAPNFPSSPPESQRHRFSRTWRKSCPRGHRSYISRFHGHQTDVKSTGQDLGGNVSDMAKDPGAMDYFQPIELPKTAVPADGEESEAESHRGPITLCGSGPRGEHRRDVDVPSCADASSAMKLDVHVERQRELATPTSSRAAPHEPNRRGHSLSAPARVCNLFGVSDARSYVHGRAVVSEASNQQSPMMYLEPSPSPLCTRTCRASFSDGANPAERLRSSPTIGTDGRPAA